jgi:rhodanese-related sulfurtransferase
MTGSRTPADVATRPPAGVDDLLARARAALTRLTPGEAFAQQARHGALVVDTRPESHRVAEGALPGAVVIERNVLEWRLDPHGPHRTPALTGPDQVVVVVCDEGYASSLAAATLRTLGLHGATDMIGGFRAWRSAGLPVDGPTL